MSQLSAAQHSLYRSRNRETPPFFPFPVALAMVIRCRVLFSVVLDFADALLGLLSTSPSSLVGGIALPRSLSAAEHGIEAWKIGQHGMGSRKVGLVPTR